MLGRNGLWCCEEGKEYEERQKQTEEVKEDVKNLQSTGESTSKQCKEWFIAKLMKCSEQCYV